MSTGQYQCNCGEMFTESMARAAHTASCSVIALQAEATQLRELVSDSLSLINLRVRSTVNKEIAITLSDEWIERAKKLLGDVK